MEKSDLQFQVKKMENARKKMDEEKVKANKVQSEIARLERTKEEYQKSLEESKTEEVSSNTNYAVVVLKYIESK